MNDRIESDGVATRIIDQNGNDISGKVSGIAFRHSAGGIPVAEFELAFIELTAIDAPARMIGPSGKDVRRIEYADGSFDEFPET